MIGEIETEEFPGMIAMEDSVIGMTVMEEPLETKGIATGDLGEIPTPKESQ